MKNLRTRALIYALALSAGSAYAASPFRVGVVTGESMAPTMHNGQLYLLDRTAYRDHAPERGDVIVFRRGAQTFVKRILAVPGDSFHVVRRQQDLTGDALVRDFEVNDLARLARNGKTSLRVVRRSVPAGFLYAVGDNFDLSEDSRVFGFVPLEDVVGRLVDAPAGAYQLYEMRAGPPGQVLHMLLPSAAG